MVSALWKACSDGDVGTVSELLNDGSQHDLEIKDQAGVTPLIEAVKNGHIEVVRLLLEKGVDPTNSSAQGPPEQHTSNPAVLELLSSARNKIVTQSVPMEQNYSHDPSNDPAKGYYPPPGPFYYPMPPPMMPEGGVPYYPPPPPPPHHMSDPSGMSNLPPPEIARMIPCRYYPACRYGASCMFAHPQGPYLQGPLPPPAQYPAPYDPMNPAPYPSYYPVPQPSFQSPPNGTPLPSISPTLPTNLPSSAPPMVHSRNNSDLAPPVQPAFPPAGVPPPMPYGVVPPPYAHGGPMPIPMQSHSPMGGPHSPQQSLYPSASPGGMIPGPPHYAPPPVIGGPYPQGIPNGHSNDPTTSPKSPLQLIHPDGYGQGHRESYGHHRRGSGRRPSFGMGRKPPCLFFPAGRCKNGDDCRFPHVLDGPLPPPPPFATRGGHRPRPSFHANGATGLEDRFATLTTQDGEQTLVQAPPSGVNGVNGGNISNGSSRSQSTEPGNRGRNGSGYRPSQYANGYRGDKKQAPPPRPQRLPSADEFPVLAGGTTPPLRSPGTGSASGWSGGLTAAQILQAPAPKRDSLPGTRGASPTNARPAQPAKEEPKAESTGAINPTPASKLPVSFAAVAAPEAVKEVAIAA